MNNVNNIKQTQQEEQADEAIIGKPFKPMATEGDLHLLEHLGVKKLEQNQLYGVLDRLRNSGYIGENYEHNS